MLGKRIDKLRLEKGYSQPELAKKAGIPYQTINAIITGARPNPTIDVLNKIAKALGVSVDQLLGTATENNSLDEEIANLPEPLNKIMKIYKTLPKEKRLEFWEGAAEIIKKFEVINPKIVEEFLDSVKRDIDNTTEGNTNEN